MKNYLFLNHTRLMFLFLMVICISALAIAYSAEHIWGIRPCILCEYERIPYWVSFLFASLGYFLYPKIKKPFLALLFCSFLIEVGISFYHIGIEHHFFDLPAMCGGEQPLPQSMEDLQKILLSSSIVHCDEVPFRFLGLSFTEYNFLFSLFLIFIIGWSFLNMKRE